MSDSPSSPQSDTTATNDLPPDFDAMRRSHDGETTVIAAGGSLEEYWGNIGRGQGGFYDLIREQGCVVCESHTPGCCDACA